MILSYENIEHIAAGVAKDFCNAIPAGEKKYEINIDRLAKAYLGLEVSYRMLSDDGSVLGVTAYRDAEYAVNAGDVMKIIPLKSNQVLLDRSLAVASLPSGGNSYCLTRERIVGRMRETLRLTRIR